MAVRSLIEVERTVNASGNVSLGNHIISAGLPLAGQRVTLRLDGPVAHILSGGTVARTEACPVPEQARARLRGGRAGTARPPRLPDPPLVSRRVSVRGAIPPQVYSKFVNTAQLTWGTWPSGFLQHQFLWCRVRRHNWHSRHLGNYQLQLPVLTGRSRGGKGCRRRVQTRGMTTSAVPRPLRWLDPPAGPAIELLDQTRLPAVEAYLTCADVPQLVDAVKRLAVRGAPLLGVAGAYGVALAAARGDDVPAAAAALSAARPTAVNLGWAVHLAGQAWQAAGGGPAGAGAALAQARAIADGDAAASAAMAAHGLRLVPAGARILTHCNTGSLVSAGEGTAFAVILAAHRAGRLAHLWVDETRPLLQGARLTAWEADRAGIPHALLADSAAAFLMATGQVDLVLTGADRIAADGSVANKVGTYGLAVLARQHDVPFVVVAPVSTVDLGTPEGAAIQVEFRADEEVASLAGQPVAPAGTRAWNPAFDVTPPSLVTAIVTERGLVMPVTPGNLRVLGAGADDVAGPQAAIYVER
jgi:methylthioribose-1-phosphate isomerase